VGCSTQPQQQNHPVRSLVEMRQENTVIQKWDMSCGAAALATLLTYQHQDPISERKIAEFMLKQTDPLRVKVRGGFSLLDLKRYVESREYHGNGYFKLTYDQLQEIGSAIVPVNLGDYNHFVIYRGTLGNKVLLADPAFGNRIVDVETFKQSWLQGIGFVVVRKDGKPPPNKLGIMRVDFSRVPDIAVRNMLR
jgi:uncharacterized protein